jgi:hypothetical protein
MSRFFKISKKFAHGFVLIQLSMIGLGILSIVGLIKVVDTLWQMLVSSFKKPLKLFQSWKNHEPLTVEGTLGLEAPAQSLETQKVCKIHMSAIEGHQLDHPASYDDFDDEAHIDHEQERPSISIEILRRDEAPEPNMPSSFFAGCGSDGAQFKVKGEGKPSYEVISSALYRWADDSCLIRYEAETGVGYFRIVDGEAPEAGAVIDLS